VTNKTIFYGHTKARQQTARIKIIKINANVLNECLSRRVEIISKGQFTRMLSHFDLLHTLLTTTDHWTENEYANECVPAERSDGGKDFNFEVFDTLGFGLWFESTLSLAKKGGFQ
jgi:hypothetical protein